MRGVALLCTLGVARAALTAPPPPPASSLVKPPPAAAVNYGAETRSTYTADASRLHSDLLVNYNRMVAPRSVRLVNYSNAGTDVMVQLRFFKVESIQQREGRMRIRVWWRSSWSDLRLAWDPAQYGDVRSLKFGASDSTDSENSEMCACEDSNSARRAYSHRPCVCAWCVCVPRAAAGYRTSRPTTESAAICTF